MSEASSISALPNELLSAVLSSLPTKDLLPLAIVNRRWHSLTSRIVHRRLLASAPLPLNELILECYHPSAKISTPYLTCRHLGVAVRPITGEHDPGGFHTLYSRFRPVLAPENRRASRRSHDAASAADETATETVFLDDGERFSQLCVVTNVVKRGRRRGLFTHHVNVSEGVVRVFRHWLTSMADGATDAVGDANEALFSSILWVDDAQSVGLRFGVTSGPAERMPLISGPDDDPPATFGLVYQEILVRASRLLLAAEQTAMPRQGSGTDIVVAPY